LAEFQRGFAVEMLLINAAIRHFAANYPLLAEPTGQGGQSTPITHFCAQWGNIVACPTTFLLTN